MPEHRRGTEKSAEDLVGPPEWMESERRAKCPTQISPGGHFEASRPVSVRLSVRVRVPSPKLAPIAIDMVKRRTHERVPMQTRCRMVV